MLARKVKNSALTEIATGWGETSQSSRVVLCNVRITIKLRSEAVG